MFNRREFLKTSSLVSLSSMMPLALAKTASAATAASDEKVLVVIQLEGGNDGINTVVPFGDDGYGRARKKLRLAEKDLHKLNDHVGLHSGMKDAKELFDDGRLAVIQGVGYPNPDRSHFRSMNIWQTASTDSADHTGKRLVGVSARPPNRWSWCRCGCGFCWQDRNAARIVGTQINGDHVVKGRRSSVGTCDADQSE